jgi:predicted flavoprotein YhiN
LQQRFADALADIDPKQVIAFLIDRKQIRDDQQIVDVSSEYAREALRRITEFKQTVTEFDFIPM